MIIALFVLVVFGPDKLPELARTLGRALSMFKRAQEDMERVIRSEMHPSAKSPLAPTVLGAGVAEETKTTSPSKAAEIWATTDEGYDENEEEEE